MKACILLGVDVNTLSEKQGTGTFTGGLWTGLTIAEVTFNKLKEEHGPPREGADLHRFS